MFFHRLLFALCWLASFLVMAGGAKLHAQAIHQAIPFDVQAFTAASLEDRVALVTAALERRDAELQNFRCSHQMRSFTRRGAKLISSVTFDVRRVGPRYLARAKFEVLEPGRLPSEYLVNWDGSVQRQLQVVPPGHGTIRDEEPKCLRESAFHQALGLRVLELPMTLPAWVRDASDGNCPIRIELDNKPGPPLVKMHVLKRSVKHHTYWFDPSQDFLPVRFEFKQFDAGTKELVGIEEHETIEAREIDGMSVPWEVVRRSGFSPDSKNLSVYTCKAIAFERNTVTDQDLLVLFPPGTKVVDGINQRAYRLTEEGSEVEMQLYNPKIGKVTGSRGSVNRTSD